MRQICLKLQNGAEISRINGLCLFLSDAHRDKDLFLPAFSRAVKVVLSALALLQHLHFYELVKCRNLGFFKSTNTHQTSDLKRQRQTRRQKPEEKRRNFRIPELQTMDTT